jgi:hypothetical protein
VTFDACLISIVPQKYLIENSTIFINCDVKSWSRRYSLAKIIIGNHGMSVGRKAKLLFPCKNNNWESWNVGWKKSKVYSQTKN